MFIDKDTIIAGSRLDYVEGMKISSAVLELAEKAEFRDITISLMSTDQIFPDGVLPIISTVDPLKQNGMGFRVLRPQKSDLTELTARMNWLTPIDPIGWPKAVRNSGPLSIPLTKFETTEQLNDLINLVLNSIMKATPVEEGVLKAFEWALNEVADNVFNHSSKQYGWLQVLNHYRQKQLIFVVGDSGIGIPASMKKAFEIRTDVEAIEKAVQKGVTSRPDYGQGNGLAGTIGLVRSNEGMLLIASGSGAIRAEGARMRIFDNEFKRPLGGTIVEFRIRTDRPIDVPASLALSGREIIGDFVEMKYEDESGYLVVQMIKEDSNFGNRKTGVRFRRMVQNLLREKKLPVMLDFKDVGIVSSSFADEFLGKLFLELGPTSYSTLVRMNNVNSVVRTIIDDAVRQRLRQP